MDQPPSSTAGANPLQTHPHAFPAAVKLSAHLQRGETPITLIRTHERTLTGGFGRFFFPSNSLQDTDINVEISFGLFGFFFFLFFLIQEDASARQCGLPRSARSSAAPERGCERPRCRALPWVPRRDRPPRRLPPEPGRACPRSAGIAPLRGPQPSPAARRQRGAGACFSRHLPSDTAPGRPGSPRFSVCPFSPPSPARRDGEGQRRAPGAARTALGTRPPGCAGPAGPRRFRLPAPGGSGAGGGGRGGARCPRPPRASRRGGRWLPSPGSGAGRYGARRSGWERAAARCAWRPSSKHRTCGERPRDRPVRAASGEGAAGPV